MIMPRPTGETTNLFGNILRAANVHPPAIATAGTTEKMRQMKQ